MDVIGDVAMDREAVRLHGREMRAAREHRDVRARLDEIAREAAARAARAENRKFHGKPSRDEKLASFYQGSMRKR